MYLIVICEEGDRLDLIAFMRGSRGGGQGSGPPPLNNNQALGLLSNTGLDPLKNLKATKPHSMLDQHRSARETPLNGVSPARR